MPIMCFHHSHSTLFPPTPLRSSSTQFPNLRLFFYFNIFRPVYAAHMPVGEKTDFGVLLTYQKPHP